MSTFAEWPLRRQKQFWMRLAEDQIGSWDVAPIKLSWLGYGGNAVFKVDSAQGEFVLRLHPPGRFAADTLRSELIWLQHIRANTEIRAPTPIATSAGEFYGSTISRELPSPHQVYSCLFEYVSGKPTSPVGLTLEDLNRIGILLARLHCEGQFAPPKGFSRPRLDGSGSLYRYGEYEGVMTRGQSAILSQVAHRVKAAMVELGETANTFGMIHGDLLAKNILFEDGQPAALDFEYCAWGYYLYDLAPLLWQLKGERAEDYRHLEAALWSGYTSLRPLDNDKRQLLEDFVAARQIASLHWLIANSHHSSIRRLAPSLIAARADELKSYLDEGVLRRHTATL